MADAITEAFGDQETTDFFEKGGYEDSTEDVSAVESTPENENNSESETETNDSETIAETENAEEGDQESEGVESGSKNDQDRFRAMADEERIKRKEIQKQIETIKQENESLKATFNKILSKAQEQAKAANEPQPPSFEDDPIAALKYENDQLKKEMNGFKEFTTKQQEQAEYARKQNEFVNTYRSKAEEFKQSNPDFQEAYDYAMKGRLEEFKIAGYTDQQARQLIIEDEAAIVANALSQGKNPAESIYNLAKLRGYKKESTLNTQDKINANQQKIDAMERGLKSGKSLSNSGGVARENLTPEAIAEMDDDEFAKFDWNKLLKLG